MKSKVRPYNPDDYIRGTYVEFDYPEALPLFARERPIAWPNSAHVGGLVKQTAIWTRHLVPHKYRELLCYGNMEEESRGHMAQYRRSNGIVTCDIDDLTPVYNTYYCVSCGVFFIRDFVDTRFCPAYAHCWGCLPKLSWAYCPDHSSPATIQNSLDGLTTITYPVGRNPIEISDADLEDFITNELGIG